MTVYDENILVDDPVLYLPLNDASGTTAVSLAGMDGTYSGSPTLQATGPTNFVPYAVSFDDTDDHVAIAANGFSVNADHTIEAWVYQDTLGSDDPIIGGFTSTSSCWMLIARSDGFGLSLQYDLGGGAQFVRSNSVLAVGAWKHVALTRASNVWTFYVDGVAFGSTDNDAFTTASMSQLRIGEGGGGNRWGGDIAAVALYDYALTADQIAQHFDPDPWVGSRSPMVVG